MTFIDAINIVDGIKFNTFTEDDKIRWLYELEEKIERDLSGRYKSFYYGIIHRFDGPETSLLFCDCEELYIKYLEAMIDYHNGETDSYNRAITIFNNMYQDYMNYYIRTNEPIQNGDGFIF
ncbi:MAG: hypothetical protein ACI4PL_02350 [Faecousia sp.]